MIAQIIIVVIVAVVIAVFSSVAIAGNLLYICEPNEVLVFSGRGNAGRGYYTVKGGRAFRWPLIERVDEMDLTNMIIDVSVNNAYSLGGIPLIVQGVANIKIAGHEPLLSYAVERLLNKDRAEIMRIAKDVLEGNLRGVLSQLTPEQVNDDKLMFAEKLQEEAEHDLSRLGLVLDTMKVQNVADDVGYLDSIGRKSSAELMRSARIAEANAKSRAIIEDASNRRRARLKEISSKETVACAEAERRIGDAKTRLLALVAEEEGQVLAKVVRAEAALKAETARVEQTRLRLKADVIEPAKADLNAGISAAKGEAATILEEGQATVRVLEEMIAVWQEAGDHARDIFLMQKLNTVMAAMAATIGSVKVDKYTMLPNSGDPIIGKTVKLVEELRAALGVDLPKMLEDITTSSDKTAS